MTVTRLGDVTIMHVNSDVDDQHQKAKSPYLLFLLVDDLGYGLISEPHSIPVLNSPIAMFICCVLKHDQLS